MIVTHEQARLLTCEGENKERNGCMCVCVVGERSRVPIMTRT